MTEEEVSKLTDQELLAAAKEMKSSAIMHAVLIGFLIGIILFSILKNTLGFFTLIPLYFIYMWTKEPDKNKALKKELKARGLNG